MDLIVKGIKEIDGMKFNDIEGGFGEGKKAMLVRDIANIHGRELKDINRNINNNISRFKKEVDLIDLKVGEYKSLSLELGYSFQSYANANNIYLLSERGYAKLLKILEDDVAWEQYDKLVDGYFNMRRVVNSQEEKIAMLTYQIYKGGQEGIVASQKLVEFEVEKNKKQLITTLTPTITIAEKFTKTNNTYDIGTFAKILNIKGMGRNKLFEWLREQRILMSNNQPYQTYIKYFEIIPVQLKNNLIKYKTLLKANGVEYIFTRLIKDGKIIAKSYKEIILELEAKNNKAA